MKISKCNFDLHARKPINKTAAKIFFGGFTYCPDKKVMTRDSDLPLPIRNPSFKELKNPTFENLSGIKFGRFEVIGQYYGEKGHWVVKCGCGKYSTRKHHAIKNPNNNKDCCEHCRHLEFLRNKNYWGAQK